MRKIERLKREAREAAEWRGHILTKWGTHDGSTDHAIAHCKNEGCTGQVVVDPWPLPNGIDIGGTLVALNCPITFDERGGV